MCFGNCSLLIIFLFQDEGKLSWPVQKTLPNNTKKGQNSVNVNYELQKLANEAKHASAKKKVNLAVVRRGKKNEAHAELLRLVETLVYYFLF